MGYCGLCKGSLETSSPSPDDDDRNNNSKQAGYTDKDSVDKRALVTKCGHMFHYFCLMKSVYISDGLIDCVSCQRRSLLSDSIILRTWSEDDVKNYGSTDSKHKITKGDKLGASSVGSSKETRKKLAERTHKNRVRQPKGYASNRLNAILFIKTVILGALLALLVFYTSGMTIHKEKTVDVGDFMDKVLDSSFLALKKSSDKIQGIKDEFSKQGFRGDFLRTWETFREGCYEFIHPYSDEFSSKAKRSYKSASKLFREINQSSWSTMARLSPKITTAYYTSIQKLRSFLNDNLGSKLKDAGYLGDDSVNFLNWISESWVNIYNLFDQEIIEKTFGPLTSKKGFFKKALRMLSTPDISSFKKLFPSSKSYIYVLKNIFTKDAFKHWEAPKTNIPKPSKANSKKHTSSNNPTHNPGTDSGPDWINENVSVLSSAISEIFHSIENSYKDFQEKEKVKPGYDKDPSETQSKDPNLASSSKESFSEAKVTLMNWYEEAYSQAKSKLQEIIAPKEV